MRGRFVVGDVMTTSTLPLSLGDSARVSFRSRRVLPLATGSAEVDAFAATFGFAELSENAVANAWSSDVCKLAFSLSFFVVLIVVDYHDLFRWLLLRLLFFFLFSLGLVFMLPGPYQLLSNAFCSTCISSFEPELSPARAFPLPDARRSRVRGRCSTGA